MIYKLLQGAERTARAAVRCRRKVSRHLAYSSGKVWVGRPIEHFGGSQTRPNI